MPELESMTITVPADMAAMIRSSVETGDYASINEVVRAALRDWHTKQVLQKSARPQVNKGRIMRFDTSDIPNNRILMSATEVIEEYISSNKLSVNFVAERLGISVRHLQKIFSRYNLRAHQYIISRRIECVRIDLLSENLRNESIMQIGRRWGFCEKSTFYRNYRSHFNETPYQTRLLLMDLESPFENGSMKDTSP